MTEEIIETENPKLAAISYISSHFISLLPFEVSSTPSFQIRINPKIYNALPVHVKDILKKQHTFTRGSHQPLDLVEMQKEYEQTYYWRGAKCYIFHYKRLNAVEIRYHCTYGYEGPEYEGPDTNDTIQFIDPSEFHPIIHLNAGMHETDKTFKMPDDKIRDTPPGILVERKIMSAKKDKGGTR